MKKPINILETGEYVEPYTFSTETESSLFHSYIEYIEFTEAVTKERDLLIDALQNILNGIHTYMPSLNVDNEKQVALYTEYHKAKELLATIKK